MAIAGRWKCTWKMARWSNAYHGECDGVRMVLDKLPGGAWERTGEGRWSCEARNLKTKKSKFEGFTAKTPRSAKLKCQRIARKLR